MISLIANSSETNRSSSNLNRNSHGQWKKLFIGQIPKTYSEQDVIRIFEDTCPVLRAHIICDRYTGEHKGLNTLFLRHRLCLYFCRCFFSRTCKENISQ